MIAFIRKFCCSSLLASGILLVFSPSVALSVPSESVSMTVTDTSDGLFNHVLGIAVDSAGNVYVADTDNNRIQKFTGDGTFLTKWGSFGSGDGQFNHPVGLAVNADGVVFVADAGNNRIQKFSAEGVFLGTWGSYGSGDGELHQAIDQSGGIAVDADGNVYVADTINNRIQKFTSDGAFLTKWGVPGSEAGQFNHPNDVAVDANGIVYVSDTWNYRVQTFNSEGVFLVQWGGGFYGARGIDVDAGGSVYVADTGNNRVLKFNNSGGLISEWGSYGENNGQFRGTEGIAVDSDGNAFVIDVDNNRIQKFTVTGTFLTTWGSRSFSLVSGHVYQSDGSTPIEGVRVIARMPDYSFEKDAFTAVDGSYTISGVKTGDYLIYVAEAGPYVKKYYDDTTDESQASLVTVIGPNDLTGIDINLELGGTISGHVYAADGTTPLEGIGVIARLSDHSFSNIGYSQADGSYVIAGLPSEEYLVYVDSEEYIIEYFDDVWSEFQAAWLQVTAPGGVSGIDFTLEAGGTLSGYVLASDGLAPIANAWIFVESSDHSVWYFAVTQQDGSYSVPSLPTEDYSVYVMKEGFIKEYYGGSYDYEQVSPVPVTAPFETTGIDFELDTGGSISGYIYQPDGTTPVYGARVVAVMDDFFYYNDTTTLADGSYVIDALPEGDYRVFVQADGCVSEYYCDSLFEEQALLVNVAGKNTSFGIDFVTNAYGTVTLSIGSPEFMPSDSDFVAQIDIENAEELFEAEYDILFDPTVLRLDYISDGLVGSVELPALSSSIIEIAPGHWRIRQSLDLTIVEQLMWGSGYLSGIHFHVIGETDDESDITIMNSSLSSFNGLVPVSCIGNNIYVSFIPGDANSDGSVNILDMTSIVNIILKRADTSSYADVNEDGSINVLDITKIARIILGME